MNGDRYIATWSGVLALLGLVCCRASSPQNTTRDDGGGGTAARASSVDVFSLDSHRGATALWHDGELRVSVVQDWERASPIRISRGRGPIERRLIGWVAGVRDGRVYVAVQDGDLLAIQSIDGGGTVTPLGTMPAVKAPYRYSLAVTSAGEVAIAGGDVDVDNEIAVLGPNGSRRVIGAVERGDAVVAMATDPRSPRLALVLQQIAATGARSRTPNSTAAAICCRSANTSAAPTSCARQMPSPHPPGAAVRGRQLLLRDRPRYRRRLAVGDAALSQS